LPGPKKAIGTAKIPRFGLALRFHDLEGLICKGKETRTST